MGGEIFTVSRFICASSKIVKDLEPPSFSSSSHLYTNPVKLSQTHTNTRQPKQGSLLFPLELGFTLEALVRIFATLAKTLVCVKFGKLLLLGRSLAFL